MVEVARSAVVKRGANVTYGGISRLAGCDTDSAPNTISNLQKQAGFIQPAFFLCLPGKRYAATVAL
ncbi:hypothetical protein KSC_051950 [Ktedonobacter sp. SOSP1-52]|uniref:hypothetical protein n=1 Tax=Ktedonobacter sp. SOSP1-52 TaxID=2778366 RepID=UPI0019157672|nr:hypothetical protein [Ktedonobacter sp. SOSP1-52]GHO66303.1 hypothetical protein KSC_051950 [Ktedonobacter sp. SOSP1-52]